MKKILLSVGLFSLVMVGRSQTILNELYVQPSSSTSEFFELYYAGTLPIGDNVDCWTLVSYFDNGGGDRGVYVMDLPNVNTGFTNRYLVGAATDPFTAQGSSNVVPDFNWNNMPVSGRVTKWVVDAGNTTWTQAGDPVNLLDFFNNKGGSGMNYSALIFVAGSFNNGFLGGTNQSTDPTLTALPPLNLTTLNSNVCANFTITFSNLGAMEHVTEAAGSDNGYNRTADGKCGAWEKSSNSAEHTPGSSNGANTSLSGAIVTAPEILKCNVLPGLSRVIYSITGVSGDASEAEDFPVEIQLWYDNGTTGQSITDVYVGSKFDATIADPVDSFDFIQTANIYLIYKTDRGCFDKVVTITNTCFPLPVSFTSFTATRAGSNVLLKWQTSTERNSAGFAIERNVSGVWQEVGYVPTQAPGGTSDDLLNYSFVDLNDVKGITQYRIRQMDNDSRSKYSEVRSVRGEGQEIKVTVYPNPTSDGKVNIAFDDQKGIRNVSVMDMSGRTVRQMNGITNNNITIENLMPGIYTIRVVVPETGAQTVEKIIVNKR